jgi:hypothetical protein
MLQLQCHLPACTPHHPWPSPYPSLQMQQHAHGFQLLLALQNVNSKQLGLGRAWASH